MTRFTITLEDGMDLEFYVNSLGKDGLFCRYDGTSGRLVLAYKYRDIMVAERETTESPFECVVEIEELSGDVHDLIEKAREYSKRYLDSKKKEIITGFREIIKISS